MRRPRFALVAVLLLLAVLTGCGGDPSADPSPATGGAATALRFASYDFGVNQSLVEVYAEAAR